MKSTIKSPVFRKGSVKRTRVLRWIALYCVCQYAILTSKYTPKKALKLQMCIRNRLIRDYGFNQDHFLGQISLPKFNPSYNAETRSSTHSYSKYLERLKG